MISLYSYCMPCDDGAAPNPYWGVCTLVIGKPAIRAAAEVGDWVVGTGARGAQRGDGTVKDMSGRLIYAMRVTEKMTMPEYDQHVKGALPKKVPVWRSPDVRRRLGDAIYDFSFGKPIQREGVHDEGNVATDLRGTYALLSTDFYYFGDQAVLLPAPLRAVAQNRQGHRRALNDPYVEPFVRWITTRSHKPRTLVGKPLCDLFTRKATPGGCARGRAKDDEADREVVSADA